MKPLRLALFLLAPVLLSACGMLQQKGNCFPALTPAQEQSQAALRAKLFTP